MSATPAAPFTTLIVDADDVARIGLRTLLQEDGRFTVVEERGAVAPAALVERVTALRPALTVLDPAAVIGEADAAVLGRTITAIVSHSRLCMRAATFTAIQVLDALIGGGADAYLLKGEVTSAALADLLALAALVGVMVIEPAICSSFRSAAAGTLALLAQGSTQRRALRLTDSARTFPVPAVRKVTRHTSCAIAGDASRDVWAIQRSLWPRCRRGACACLPPPPPCPLCGKGVGG